MSIALKIQIKISINFINLKFSAHVEGWSDAFQWKWDEGGRTGTVVSTSNPCNSALHICLVRRCSSWCHEGIANNLSHTMNVTFVWKIEPFFRQI